MTKRRRSSSARSPQRKPADDAAWAELRKLTAARIGLKRAGASLATGPLLEFQLAHARARDAVHEPFDAARLAADLAGLGAPVLTIASAAGDRPRRSSSRTRDAPVSAMKAQPHLVPTASLF